MASGVTALKPLFENCTVVIECFTSSLVAEKYMDLYLITEAIYVTARVADAYMICGVRCIPKAQV